jgi:hypothetical protein
MARRDSPAQIMLPIIAELMPRGDGSYILRPRPPGPAGDAWLTPKQAAAYLGISLTAVYGLLDESAPMLVSKRPLRWKILVSLPSLEAYARATADPSFWTSARLRAAHIAECRDAVCRLSALPL